VTSNVDNLLSVAASSLYSKIHDKLWVTLNQVSQSVYLSSSHNPMVGSCGSCVADPGSGAFLIPESGMGKISRSGIRDEHPGSYFRELRNNFWVKNTSILKCGSGSETSWVSS
jgi:hypothetical protein